MSDNHDIILKLIEKLEQLYKRQADFTEEIDSLKTELYRLKSSSNKTVSENKNTTVAPTESSIEEPPKVEAKIIEPAEEVPIPEAVIEKEKTTAFEAQKEYTIEDVDFDAPKSPTQKSSKSNLEKFIGENILNKIGILITIIGVAIGAKYSIENDLISPLTRIILGYFSAMGLLGFGIKLKKNYEAYSAVLVSGAIVILYFITFFAYNFYDLIPQTIAFVLMVIFTGFTIVAAINYNRQIIAHLGLVGAYAVPFLLSNNSGRVDILFTYIAIINVGILITSFKKYWKSLYYSAFVFTWLIFASWFTVDYEADVHFGLALSFSTLFFIIFYMTFLAYKMIKKEDYNSGDIIMLLANSFIFYSLGYAILDSTEASSTFLGLFTLGNAVVHFIVTAIIYKQSLGDKSLFYLASGLVLVFITIAIPVQLDGNWVTLLWIGQAALLFWIGRSRQIFVYEKLSYPLILLAFLSLLQDWSNSYDFYFNYQTGGHSTPIFNINFLSSALFILATIFIVFVSRKKNYASALKSDSILKTITAYGIPAILIFSIYYTFRLEISEYYNQLFYNSELKINTSYSKTIRNNSVLDLKLVWIINYSLLFMGALWFFNSKFIKNKALSKTAFGLTVISIFIFLVQGLYMLSELREAYLNPSEYYNSGIYTITVRYISFVFLAFAIFACYKFVKLNNTDKRLKIGYDLMLHISILWVLSSELIHWLDISGASGSYKLGLSILWGLYSFLLIAFGIWKNKKYLRIGGIGLFGITLIKLFLYDIVHLNTISKTIVFVSLGILLLIISFLYNKYKNLIADDVKT